MGGVTSFFEASLQREVTLAFFMPLVVYMADAVGTQTETVLERRLSYGPVSLLSQLRREGALGLLMGLAIGGLAWVGLWLWDGRGRIAAVIGLTIVCSSIAATLVASLLPWGLGRLNADGSSSSLRSMQKRARRESPFFSRRALFE
jgi:magnesium transporter